MESPRGQGAGLVAEVTQTDAGRWGEGCSQRAVQGTNMSSWLSVEKHGFGEQDEAPLPTPQQDHKSLELPQGSDKGPLGWGRRVRLEQKQGGEDGSSWWLLCPATLPPNQPFRWFQEQAQEQPWGL